MVLNETQEHHGAWSIKHHGCGCAYAPTMPEPNIDCMQWTYPTRQNLPLGTVAVTPKYPANWLSVHCKSYICGPRYHFGVVIQFARRKYDAYRRYDSLRVMASWLAVAKRVASTPRLLIL
jgi:hypothetical protein